MDDRQPSCQQNLIDGIPKTLDIFQEKNCQISKKIMSFAYQQQQNTEFTKMIKKVETHPSEIRGLCLMK